PFFLPLSRPHRALHSFPTRRSSDLPDDAEHLAAAGLQAEAIHRHERAVADGQMFEHNHPTVVTSRCTELFIDSRRRMISAKDLQDRKSTRLNSSHLVISYAVFCLKK